MSSLAAFRRNVLVLSTTASTTTTSNVACTVSPPDLAPAAKSWCKLIVRLPFIPSPPSLFSIRCHIKHALPRNLLLRYGVRGGSFTRPALRLESGPNGN
ncbi:hypothetical protein BJX61DRAFT_525227 [Aspergillus egyptiacus]|nr:hypothetical protein BJX61DRAFT_525227 [Aspergillus egyptiacus]